MTYSHTLENFKASMNMLQNRIHAQPNGLSFQHIIDACPACIYWKDLEGKYLGCNRPALQFLNLKHLDEFIGKTDYELAAPEIAKQFRESDAYIVKNDCARLIKETIPLSGTIHMTYKSPLRDNNNKIIGIVGTSIDITKHDQAEKQLRQVFDLASAFEAKERFLRNISHEIRIPLQAMVEIPKGLKEGYYQLTEAEKYEYIDAMVSASDRLMSLMTSLLDLSKFRNKTLTMTFKKENIADIVKEVIAEFKPSHDDIELKMLCNEGLLSVVCDRLRVAQVIRNLIGNSIRHGGKNDPIRISLANYKDGMGNYVKFTIKDEGIGIPYNDKIIIFDAFVEGERTRSNSGGTGLGLSMAKEIINAHKGKIWVEDLNPGEKGARISFVLSTQIA